MKHMIVLFGIAVAALSLAAPALADTYVISHGVWGHYQKYLRAIGSVRPGAFAITTDGNSSYYIWCQDVQCIGGTTYRHDAIQACEREYDTKCVAFADRDDILVSYTLSDAGSEPTAIPTLAPAPVTRISLSSAAQSTLDRYLDNSKSPSKAWALAITKDGAKAFSAACPTTGGGGYFGGGGSGPGCDLNEGQAQELAEKLAIKSCGGLDDCVLLYRGQNKAANIEIVAN